MPGEEWPSCWELDVVDLLPGAVPRREDRVVRVLPRGSMPTPQRGDGEVDDVGHVAGRLGAGPLIGHPRRGSFADGVDVLDCQ